MSRESTTNWYEKILSLFQKVRDDQNIADDIREITNLLNQYNSPQDINLLLQDFSKKDVTTDTTGLIWLMSALVHAADKNNLDAITKITDIITTLLNKCKTETDISLLLQGLSEKRIAWNYTHTTGLYRLIAVLYKAASTNNLDVITKITNIMTILLDKCKTETDISLLLQGLSEKRIATEDTTGLTWLIQAKTLCPALDKQLFFQLFEKMGAVKFASMQDKEMIATVCSHKADLRNALQEYINTITDLDILKRITDPTTLLGQFIDYQTSFIPSKNSHTRTLVNARIQVLLTPVKVTSATAAATSVKIIDAEIATIISNAAAQFAYWVDALDPAESSRFSLFAKSKPTKGKAIEYFINLMNESCDLELSSVVITEIAKQAAIKIKPITPDVKKKFNRELFSNVANVVAGTISAVETKKGAVCKPSVMQNMMRDHAIDAVKWINTTLTLKISDALLCQWVAHPKEKDMTNATPSSTTTAANNNNDIELRPMSQQQQSSEEPSWQNPALFGVHDTNNNQKTTARRGNNNLQGDTELDTLRVPAHAPSSVETLQGSSRPLLSIIQQ